MPCKLVSTQVIEAGVDLDFPFVLRALGPLDAVIQAAGRCNREGFLGHAGGKVVIFRPADGGMPLGAYRTAAGVTPAVLAAFPHDAQPDRPDVLRRYFEQLFSAIDPDSRRIQALRAEFNYPDVAQRFRMIDDATESIVVSQYGDVEERTLVRQWIRELREGGAQARRLLRRLQPYLVSVRRREAERYRRQGLIGEVLPNIGEWQGRYDPVRGLSGEGLDPDQLVV
jgi:CRISPR-associated endonuclease/helicase Cas3